MRTKLMNDQPFEDLRRCLSMLGLRNLGGFAHGTHQSHLRLQNVFLASHTVSPVSDHIRDRQAVASNWISVFEIGVLKSGEGFARISADTLDVRIFNHEGPPVRAESGGASKVGWENYFCEIRRSLTSCIVMLLLSPGIMSKRVAGTRLP